MTEDRIRDLLRDLAAEAPVTDLAGAAWHRARRVRQRRQVAVGAVAVGAVAAGGFGVVSEFGRGPDPVSLIGLNPEKATPPDELSPACAESSKGMIRPFVPPAAVPMVDMEPIRSPEELVELMGGDSPWGVVTGTIGDVEKPDPDRSRLELSVEITDLIHESEPGLIGKDRVALDFWEGPGYNVGGLVCTLDDWRYALPTGSPVVAVIYQPREGVLRPHNVGLFFEGKNGKGIRSAMLPDYEKTGEWKRIASLDALADRLRAAVEKK